MFIIGLTAGALLMFILIVIYSSLAVAGRADKNRAADEWDYLQENLNAKKMNDNFEPAFLELDNPEFESDFRELKRTRFRTALMETSSEFMEENNPELESEIKSVEDND